MMNRTMKQGRKGLIRGTALLAVLLLAACSDLINPPAGPAGSGTGTVQVSVTGEGPGFSARTIYPTAPGAGDFTYAYSFTTSPGGNPVTDPAPSGQTFTLPVGDYNLRVDAYLGSIAPGNLVTSGSTASPFAVTNGGSTPVSIALEPVATGPGTGTLTYTITYPSGAAVDAITWGLVGVAGTVEPAYSGGTVTKTAVAAGYYVLTASLSDSGKTTGKSEVVHIYQGLTTNVAWDFAANRFTAALSTDAGLATVLGQSIAAGSEAGSQGTPKTAAINVANGVSSVTPDDVVPAAGAVALLYSDAGFSAAVTASLALSVGSNSLYVQVTAEDGATILHYEVTITRAAPPVPIDLNGKTTQNDIRDAITAGIANVTGSGTQNDPKVIPLENLDLSSGSNLANLYTGAAAAFTGGEYLSLDLAGCTGAAVSGMTTTTLPNATRQRFAAITLPNTVTSLTYANSTGAFESFSSLKSITLPGSVQTIDQNAFIACTNLTSIILPASVQTIGNMAFRQCTSLTSVTIPANVNSIGSGAFMISTNLATLIFEGATPPTVGASAFDWATALASGTVNVPNGTVAAYKAELTGKGVTGTTITDAADGGSDTDTL